MPQEWDLFILCTLKYAMPQEWDRTRALYRNLLDRTKHVNVKARSIECYSVVCCGLLDPGEKHVHGDRHLRGQIAVDRLIPA